MDTEQITELAEKLGKAIADSPQAQRMEKARKALHEKPELKKLLNDYQTQSDKIARLEQEQKPVEPEDKHRLEELQNKLLAAAEFKELTAAQVEYVDLMRKVNQAISKHMVEVGGQTPQPKATPQSG